MDNFKIVFTPKEKGNFRHKRFYISLNTIEKYIGECNAITALSMALESKQDKVSKKFRKYGKIDFYIY
ncbi:MAG: hypothetical protein JWP81_4727 [Ferruginibacter sp.]|nr:hypothetical protein [Ferruginibacter sp.]